jgi:signal transduction histidine kinase/CheY-like chemotaxis protein
MSVPETELTTPAAKPAFRARPKPYSIERRFRLMQAATVALALGFVCGLLIWDLSFEGRLSSSLENLHTTLTLNREIHEKQEILAIAFWSALDSQPDASRSDYEECARLASESLQRYDAIPLPQEEQSEKERLQHLQNEFLKQTAHLLDVPAGTATLVQKAAIDQLSRDIDVTLGRLDDLQTRHVETLNAEMTRFWRRLKILMFSFAVLALLTMAWFRHVHRHHLWEPLEELRQMVLEVRRGNLNVTGEAPSSVELGTLVGAFLEMAREVREVRDSLEERVMERTIKLEHAQSELLQSAKLASLGQLVSGVAHEINNPLTSILGFSEVLLSRKGDDPAAQGPLRTIRAEALRLRHLVANLTTFSRRVPHRTERFDLRQALVRFADLRDYQLKANNLSLHLDCPPAPVWVNADPDQILQVLLNLALNAEQAIKARLERGDIWIACGREGDAAYFSVKDNGAGMSPEVREHIFDPFFTTRPPGEGSGLGLSISYGIILQHAGTIAVESALGEGTTVRVQLPLAPKQAPMPPGPPAAAALAVQAATQASTRHALVIDDEPGILEMVSDALDRVPCRSTLLPGSASVEAALAHDEFDFVICDLKMPGRNGFEVYKLIRELRPALAARFILMTGNLADAEKYPEELAAVSLLPKPFTLASLREAVQAILQKRPSTEAPLPPASPSNLPINRSS